MRACSIKGGPRGLSEMEYGYFREVNIPLTDLNKAEKVYDHLIAFNFPSFSNTVPGSVNYCKISGN